MKTHYLLISGFLFGMLLALLMMLNLPTPTIAYAQVADILPTLERTLTPSAMPVSLPLPVQAQNVSVDLNFITADAPQGLVMTAGTQTRQYLSAPIVVPLEDIAPVLDVGMVFELTQDTYNNDAIRISLRGSVDGVVWAEWQEQDHFHFDTIGMYSHLVSLDKQTRYVQVQIVWDEAQLWQPVTITRATLSFISAGETPPEVIANIQRQASSGHTIALPHSAPQPVVSRSAWGCPDGQGSRWSPQYTTVTHLIVHHTVSANSGLDWAAHVRSIWNYHAITLKWGDIGYNYLIDPNGVIYEGRAGGDGSIGAHFSCMNSRTMGVALIGTFTSVSPTTAALNSLKNLLAWKANTFNLNPTSWLYHVPSQLTMWHISGHRDGNTSTQGCPSGTSCPGDVLYNLLPNIRQEVASLIVATATPTHTLTPTPTSTPTNTPTPTHTPTNYTEWEISANLLLHQLQTQNTDSITHLLVVYGERELRLYVDYDGITYIIPMVVQRRVVEFLEITVLPIVAVDGTPATDAVREFFIGVMPARFARALDTLLDAHYTTTPYDVEDILIHEGHMRVGVLLGD